MSFQNQGMLLLFMYSHVSKRFFPIQRPFINPILLCEMILFISVTKFCYMYVEVFLCVFCILTRPFHWSFPIFIRFFKSIRSIIFLSIQVHLFLLPLSPTNTEKAKVCFHGEGIVHHAFQPTGSAEH